jgi:hypothetical protein
MSSSASLCRQCTIPLQEDVEVNEYFALQFHGENLWGNTQFNKSIMVEEKIGELLLLKMNVQICCYRYLYIKYIIKLLL